MKRIKLLWLTFVFAYTRIGWLRDLNRDSLHATAILYGSLRQANYIWFGRTLF